MHHLPRALRSPVCTLAALLCLVTSLSADDWPQWRGPHRDGRSAETGLLKAWPAGGPPLAWKAGELGAGYASVAVAQGGVYTAGDVGRENFVLRLKESDGTRVWATRLGKAGAPGWGGFGGPRGTPTLDGDRLYALGQYGELVCLETATGKEVWRRDLTKDLGGTLPEWGFSESPLVDGDRVLVTPGGAKGTIAALDKKTGQPLWQSAGLTDEAQYTSLVPATIGGVPQYVQLTMASVAGISPAKGDLLWRAPRKGATAVIPTPVIKGDLVYVSSGYGTGCNLFRVTKSGDAFAATQVYANKTLENHHGGVVLVGDHLYGFDERKGWTCQLLESGAAVWQEKGKLGKGSITYADGRLYCREEAEKGSKIALIEATPDGFRESGRFEQPDQSGKQTWPHPVIANGRLYLRDQENLFVYDVRAK